MVANVFVRVKQRKSSTDFVVLTQIKEKLLVGTRVYGNNNLTMQIPIETVVH